MSGNYCNIFFKGLRHVMVCSILTLFLVNTGMPLNLSHAQTRYKPEVVLPVDYPNGFDGFGRIDDMDDNGVVIQDSLFKLAPSVTFHTPTDMHSTAAYFEIGNLVGYLTNKEGEIISLWLIE